MKRAALPSLLRLITTTSHLQRDPVPCPPTQPQAVAFYRSLPAVGQWKHQEASSEDPLPPGTCPGEFRKAELGGDWAGWARTGKVE